MLWVAGNTPGYLISGQSISASALSWQLWFRDSGNQLSGAGPISFANTTSGLGFQLETSGANQVYNLDTPASSIAMFTATTGTWNYAAGNVNSTTYNAYWAPGGGALSTGTTTDLTSLTTYTNFWIGSAEGVGEVFKGNTACVKVWQAVLTQAEFAQEEYHCRPIRTLNLAGSYPNYTQGDGNIDYSGNGFNMTNPGTKPATDTGPPISY